MRTKSKFSSIEEDDYPIKRKQTTFLDAAEQERKIKEEHTMLVLEKYKSLESKRQDNLQRILKMLDDSVLRQSECRKIDELINPKLTSPEDIIAGRIVEKLDPVVCMLDSCKTGRKQQKQLEDE